MVKVNGETVLEKRFPDGTLNIKGNPELCDGEVLISWHYTHDAEFMMVSFLTRYYQAHDNDVYLYLPYIPNARMDRIEHDDDIFTMKYFGDMINSLDFKGVYIVDAHSSVAIAVIKNVHIINIDPTVNGVVEVLEEHTGQGINLFYPDEGAMKRYHNHIERPFAFGVKKRDWDTGNIIGLDVFGMTAEEIKGKNFLIRDDICSKGGTFYHSAKKLKELGANNVYLFVTHMEDSIYFGEFSDEKKSLLETGLIHDVFTTNSIGHIFSYDNCNVCIIDIDNCVYGVPNSCDDSNCLRDCGGNR